MQNVESQGKHWPCTVVSHNIWGVTGDDFVSMGERQFCILKNQMDGLYNNNKIKIKINCNVLVHMLLSKYVIVFCLLVLLTC